MKILNNIRNFGKDIRLVKLTLPEIHEVIRNYIKQKSWVVSGEKTSQDSFCIRARNNRASIIRLFFSREPQIVSWTVSPENYNSKIELKFSLFKKFLYPLYCILAIVLIGYLFYSILTHLNISIDIKKYLYPICWFLPVTLLLLLSFFIIWLTTSSKYERFKKEFYLKIREVSGAYEQLIVDKADFPAVFYLFFPLLFLTFLLMYVMYSIHLGFLFYSLFFVRLPLLFILLYLALVILLFLKPGMNAKFRLNLFGFILGIVLSSYCLAPVYLKTHSEIFQSMRDFKEVNIITNKLFDKFPGEQEALVTKSEKELDEYSFPEELIKLFTPELRAKIRDAYHGVVKGIFVSVFEFFVIFGMIIFLVCAFKWLSGGPFPIRILESLNLYKRGYKNLEFQSAFSNDIFTKAFSIIVFVIWIVCSFAALFGVYFAFSSLEFLLFGKNYFLQNNFLRLSVTNLEAFFEFIGFFIELSTLNKNMSISAASKAITGILTRPKYCPFLLSRLIIALYALPLIIIFFILLNKWFKEVLTIKRLMSNFVPNNLRETLAEICQSSRIKIPVFVLKNEPIIMSETKWIFPFGNCIIISNKATEFLDNKEVEALLAHEIGHIKHHTFVFNLLDFLSQITLFGKGFLISVLNTKEMEYRADDFSLKWISRKGYPKDILKNLLKKIVITNSTLKYFAYSRSLLGFSELNPSFEESEQKLNFWSRLKLLYALYFGDIILSYVHPSIEERINRIEVAS